VLATTRIPGIAPHQWHRLKLQFKGAAITASVDGQPALAATDTLYANGMAGLLAGVTARQTLSTPWFDHVVIAPPGSPVPAPAVAARGQAPLYPK
jgi:galactosylceramidase